MTKQAIEKLDLNKLKEEIKSLSMPAYVYKQMFGGVQKKINEMIKRLNELHEND